MSDLAENPQEAFERRTEHLLRSVYISVYTYVNACRILQRKPGIIFGRPDFMGGHGQMDMVLPRKEASICTADELT